MRKRLIPIVLLLGTATPAAAQDRLWGHSGPWEIRQSETDCSFHYRARDADETEIVITRGYYGSVSLQASGKGWSYGDAPKGLGIEGDGVMIASRTYSGILPPAPGRSGFVVFIEPAELSRVLASRRIAARQAGYPGKVPLIAMPPSMAVERDMARCLAEIEKRASGSGEPAVTPPLSRGAVGSWTTIDDYPPFAIRKRAGGHLRVRLRVNALGRVTGCDVVESTGEPGLDANYCAIYRRRARFSTPAKDAKGRATNGTFDIVRELVPPPQPPPMYSTIRRP